MVSDMDKYRTGDDTVLPDIYRSMQGYIDLLRAHIGKENNVLFRMADKVLSAAEQEELLKKFTEMEATPYGQGRIKGFITDIEGLEVKTVTR